MVDIIAPPISTGIGLKVRKADELAQDGRRECLRFSCFEVREKKPRKNLRAL